MVSPRVLYSVGLVKGGMESPVPHGSLPDASGSGSQESVEQYSRTDQDGTLQDSVCKCRTAEAVDQGGDSEEVEDEMVHHARV